TYETKGVYNVISNKFEAISDNSTQWKSENEFQFSGFMRIMSLFMKSAFPRETMKFMKQFKAFAESYEE
ncbi:MAG: SRPBCC family protein, partial [Reichenbachiella sp.]